VYTKLPVTTLLPKILQVAPGLTAAPTGIRGMDKNKKSIDKKEIAFLLIHIA
jgi:hypothetical protein